MNDLTNLLALADKLRYDGTWYPAHPGLTEHENDNAFIAACCPQVVAALVRVAMVMQRSIKTNAMYEALANLDDAMNQP